MSKHGKNKNIERRFIAVEELRESEDGTLVGYASVFNQPADSGWGFTEVVMPGAFTKTLADGADVRALWNHDPNFVLGRTTAGTLELKEDDHGLRSIITPPDTQWANDLRKTIKRGDVSQMSFGFRCIEENWKKDGDTDIRELREVELLDVSPVTYPFYPTTQVDARAEVVAPASPEEPEETEEETTKPNTAAKRQRELELAAAEL